MVELDGPMVHFHNRGFRIIAVIPDCSASGEDDMDLVFVAGNWVDQRGHLDFQYPIDAKTAILRWTRFFGQVVK